jgi:hypothetical protein
MPARIARLPRDPTRPQFPVPWFVVWIDGKPDFRVVKPGAVADALRSRRCWICGGSLGRHVAYVIGPMCAVNRVSAEPPSHRDCAIYAAQACPFLARPHMRRREHGMPEQVIVPAGIAIKRNPGVALVWITGRIRTRRDPDGGLLFDVGEPTETLWYCQGRPATRNEVLESIESGLPLLAEMAEKDGPRAVRQLEAMTATAMALLPAQETAA